MHPAEERWEPLGPAGVFTTPAYRFTTDTLLLAWFSQPKDGECCAEFGSGCGAIPVLWCVRGAPARVYAIEQQADACRLLEQSVRKSGLCQIEIWPGDLRDFSAADRRGRFDRIACNPPYFPAGSGPQSPLLPRRLARQEACPFPEIARAAAASLRWGGRFFLCQRPDRLCGILTALHESGLEPKRLRFVQKDAASAPRLFLLESLRGGKPGLRVEPPLLLPQGGADSPEWEEIYQGYQKEEPSCPER